MSTAKTTHETLNMLARQVIRTFYPERFIVANELLRHNEMVEVATLAANLNLAPSTVQASLTDLQAMRFAQSVQYPDVPAYWGFDYHNFFNVVTYKIATLKARESAKNAGKATGDYVCDKCNRSVTWEQFTRAAADPVCPQRNCGGKLQKGTRRVAEGLRALDVFTAALKKVVLAEIPMPGDRALKAALHAHARQQEAAGGEAGDAVAASTSAYQLPPGESKYVVLLVPSPIEERGGFLVPPELDMVMGTASAATQSRGSRGAKPLPPWLEPEDRTSGEQPLARSQSGISGAMEKLKLLDQAPEPDLEQPMKVYYQHLARQVGGPDAGVPAPMDLVFSDDEGEQESCTQVHVNGVERLLCDVTAQDMEAMTADEYCVFYEAYTREAEQRVAKWTGNAK